MDETIETYIDQSGTYLESLVRVWESLRKTDSTELVTLAANVIKAELELGLMAAEKAKSEILKSNKNNLKSINGDKPL